MSARAVLLAAAAALLLAAPARADVPPDRLDTLAAALRDGPLAADADLAWVLSDAQRTGLTRRLRASPVPFHVALLPALEEDESGGDQYLQLRGLADRVDAPGVYVVVDALGQMEAATVRVARDTGFSYEQLKGTGSRQAAGSIVPRLESIVDRVASAPAGRAAPFSATASAPSDPGADDEEGPRELLIVVLVCAILGICAGVLLYALTRLGMLVARVTRG